MNYLYYIFLLYKRTACKLRFRSENLFSRHNVVKYKCSLKGSYFKQNKNGQPSGYPLEVKNRLVYLPKDAISTRSLFHSTACSAILLRLSDVQSRSWITTESSDFPRSVRE